MQEMNTEWTTKAGKVWFITGASSGFGRAMTLAVLESGGRVVAAGLEPEAIVELVRPCGDRALAFALDVADAAAAREAVERCGAQFGRLDVLYNNAGYGHVGAGRRADGRGVAAADQRQSVRRHQRIPETHVMRRHVAPRLSQDFTIVATDLRGYGDSSKPRSTPDYARRKNGIDAGLDYHCKDHQSDARVIVQHACCDAASSHSPP
jgi:NAD(P)-dependent dehydrogenase (short-subunit alcohol dehydrogenase family)